MLEIGKIRKFRKIEIFQNMLFTRFRPWGTFLRKKIFFPFFSIMLVGTLNFSLTFSKIDFFAFAAFDSYTTPQPNNMMSSTFEATLWVLKCLCRAKIAICSRIFWKNLKSDRLDGTCHFSRFLHSRRFYANRNCYSNGGSSWKITILINQPGTAWNLLNM